MIAMSRSEYLEFQAPCCGSERECIVRRHVIIGFKGRPRVLREIYATRCHRGITMHYKFYPSDSVLLIEYYRSNRGNNHITILWKPKHLSDKEAELIVRLALGLEEIYEFRILNSNEIVEKKLEVEIND